MVEEGSHAYGVAGWVDEHDLETKVRHMREFLTRGHSVKLVLKHKKGQTRDRQVGTLRGMVWYTLTRPLTRPIPAATARRNAECHIARG